MEFADLEARFSDIRDELARAVAATCPHWLADRRDDIVQNAVLKLVKAEAKSEGNRQFVRSYLWKVAYSALVDEINRVTSRKESALEQALDNQISDRSDPRRETESRELGAAIQGCLRKLVAPRRRAVVLYLAGYGVPESAGLLGWRRKRVENLVYRGLANLRSCLRAKGFAS